VYAFGSVSAFLDVSRAPEVTFLEEAGREPLSLSTGTWASRARTLYERTGGLDLRLRDENDRYLDGRRVGIAVVDSGIDATHPDLTWHQQTVRNYKVKCTVPNLADAGCAGPVVMADVPNSDTTGGHGTHVAGIAAGTGAAGDADSNPSTTGDRMLRGVAPRAKLYGFGVGETLVVRVSNAAAAFQWIHDHAANPCAPAPPNRTACPPIRVVNNSWGGAGAHDPNLAISKLSNALVAKGITVVFAAGNSGGDGSSIRTNPYANNPTPGVLSVANYDDDNRGTRDNQLSGSSSRGKADQPKTWPDVSAPGTFITSTCLPTLPVCDLGADLPYPPYYAKISGTSMAAPHTAGVVAQLYQADPKITPAEVEAVLKGTAYKFTAGAPYQDGSSFDKGAGLIDAREAALAVGAGDSNRVGPATTVISDDATDHPNGALDLRRVTLTERRDDTVVITWQVRNALEVVGDVEYRLVSNVDGRERRLVLRGPGRPRGRRPVRAAVKWNGLTVTDASTPVAAQSVGRIGNNIFAVYSAEILGAVPGAIHFDTWAASYLGLIHQDRAPRDLGATFLTFPARGEEHVFGVFDGDGKTTRRRRTTTSASLARSAAG
jgi:serine protease AprX